MDGWMDRRTGGQMSEWIKQRIQMHINTNDVQTCVRAHALELLPDWRWVLHAAPVLLVRALYPAFCREVQGRQPCPLGAHTPGMGFVVNPQLLKLALDGGPRLTFQGGNTDRPTQEA